MPKKNKKKTKNEILKIKEKNIEMSGSICKSAILNIFVRLLYISLNFVKKNGNNIYQEILHEQLIPCIIFSTLKNC